MKVLYIIFGSITLGLGIVGIFLPLVPTTPFLLLSAALYCRSSRRLYGWLMSNRWLGHYISNYRTKRAIALPAKIVSLALMWGTILYCIFFATDLLWLRILLSAILVGVTTHILSFRTIRTSEVIKMVRIRTPRDIASVAAMACEIWLEYYSFVSYEQNEYMLAKMQSPEAIASQIENEGYEYFFISCGGRNVGYVGIKPDGDRLFLSKLYVLKEYRGKGCAHEAFLFLTNICLRRGLKAVWLTANRNNQPSIDIYRKSGFKVIGEEVADIGNGFVMDDFILELSIDN